MRGYIHIEMQEDGIHTGCHIEHASRMDAMMVMHVMCKCLKFDSTDLGLFAMLEGAHVFDQMGTESQVPVGDLEQISPELADIFEEALYNESGRF